MRPTARCTLCTSRMRPVIGRSGSDIEQAEEPALPKHRQHKVAMVAQAVVEGEKDSVRGLGLPAPNRQRPRAPQSHRYLRTYQADARNRQAQDKGNGASPPRTAAHSDTSPASYLRSPSAPERSLSERRYTDALYCSNTLLSVPIPSIDTSTVFLASFIVPTPIDVPQAMTSPGIKVMSCEIRLTSLTGGKIISLSE